MFCQKSDPPSFLIIIKKINGSWTSSMHVKGDLNLYGYFTLPHVYYLSGILRKYFRGDSKLPDHHQEDQEAQEHPPCRFKET